MKKARIMLTAIAVLAVIGGALAFKAKKFANADVFCAQRADDDRICKDLVLYQTEQIPAEFTSKPCDPDFGLGTIYYTQDVNTCTSNVIVGTVYVTDL